MRKYRHRKETRIMCMSIAKMNARRQEGNSFQALRGNYFYLGILFTPKTSIIYEERAYLFSDMHGHKKSSPTNSLESDLKVQFFCSSKTNNLIIRIQTQELNSGKY